MKKRTYADLIPTYELTKKNDATVRKELEKAVDMVDAVEGAGRFVNLDYATGHEYGLLTSYILSARTLLISRLKESLPEAKPRPLDPEPWARMGGTGYAVSRSAVQDDYHTELSPRYGYSHDYAEYRKAV